MKVLVLSQHYWPESFRINDVTRSLLGAGCAITVLTGKPNYPAGEIFEGYTAWGTQRTTHEGIEILRVPLAPRGRGRALDLMRNYLSFILSASVLGAGLLRGRRFDVIFVYGTSPILQAIAGIALKRRTGARLVVWVQDLWPDSLELTGFVRNRRVLNAVGAIVRWIYRRSDLLLVQSEAFVAPVRAMVSTTPVRYHPNPGDREASAEADAPKAASPFELPAGFNVVFAGNLGTVQALDTVLDAAQCLGPDSGINWILVGDGARSAWLEEQVKRRGLGNVHLPGRFPASTMPPLFAAADALLVSLIRGPAMSMTIPSKLQSYLVSGRPLIAAMDGEGARMVEVSGAGVSCPAEDAGALSAAAVRLKSMSPAEREELGRSGRAFYDKNFAPGLLANRLADHFRQCVNDTEKARR